MSATHHVIVEVLQHTTSPLTSALTIFFTYKVSHIPKMRVYIRASTILFNEWRRGGRALPPPPPPPTSGSDASKTAGVLARPSQLVVTLPLARPISGLSRRGAVLWPRVDDRSRRNASTASAAIAAGLAAGGAPTAVDAAAVAAALATAQPAAALASASSSIVAAASVTEPASVAASFADTSAVIASVAADAGQHAASTGSSIFSAIMTTGPITGNTVPFSVAYFESLINWFHESGLNWGAAIVSATLVFRVLVLPLNVSLVRNTARLFLIRSQIAELRHTMEKGTQAMQVQAARDFFALLKRAKAHPFKNLASPLLFPPIFLSLFGAVHGLCATVPDLQTGGGLWFPDLTQPDHSGLLPVVSALTWLATIELASGKAFHMPMWMLSATRLLAVACIPITEPLPAGVFMFWITSNLFAMGRATMLRQRPIARFFRVPPVNRPHDH